MEAEKALTSGALNGGAGLGAAAEGPALAGGVGAEEGAGAGHEDLIAAEEFFKVFDALIDAKYPGDRGSATKVKVAFRKVRECGLLSPPVSSMTAHEDSFADRVGSVKLFDPTAAVKHGVARRVGTPNSMPVE